MFKTSLMSVGKARDCIHNTSLSSQLTNGLNKQECYITVAWKGLLGTSILAYWAHFISYEEN